LHAAPAAAQSCVILPPGQPPAGAPAAEAVREAAARAVASTLTEGGLTVVPADEGQRRIADEPFAGCRDIDCGANVVERLDVDFAVLVTVWAPRGTPTTVVVTLIGPGDSVA